VVISIMDGFDRYGGPPPTPQSIWDYNEPDDSLCDRMAYGEAIRLASAPITPPGLEPWQAQDITQYVAVYKAEQRDRRHWEVFGKFETDRDWQPVGWLVR